MRLRHLRYFITVAEELSFTRASARLHIEPSPLSRAIKDLENDVGVELLHRSKGRIKLTWAGEVFCKDARRLLALYDDARIHANKTVTGSQGRVRIGIADSLAQPRLTRLLAMCREEEPLTTIGITEMTSGELLAALNHELIDAGFTVDGEEVDGFVKEATWSERPVAAVPRHHPLLALDRIPLREVVRYPLILCHPERCAGGYKLVVQALAACGLPPPSAAEYISGHEPMMLLVAAGYGVGFGLESQAARYNIPEIILRPIADEDAVASTFVVTRNNTNSPELQRFIDRAKRVGGTTFSDGNGTAAA